MCAFVCVCVCMYEGAIEIPFGSEMTLLCSTVASSFLDILLSISNHTLERISTSAALVQFHCYKEDKKQRGKLSCKALPVYIPGLLLYLAAKEICYDQPFAEI